jgi:ABC-2 type transport system ATP-binding protein
MDTTTTATDRPTAGGAGPERPTETVVSARGLRCRYGDTVAVDGIDLDVRRGELFALLGTNGAGKTTTLDTLEGRRRPDAGDVMVLDLDPRRHRRELAARVGTVLQSGGVPAALTPRELLRTWARLHPDAEALHADEALARVGLGHRAEVRAGSLSGGERRRLDLALALSTQPELLFLDEPTTGMDPEARERTWGLLRDLLRTGTTIVLTTHYLEEADALADRIAIMHRGRLARRGTRAELVADHAGHIDAEVATTALREGLPPLQGAVERDLRGGSTRLHVRTHALQPDLTALLTWAAASRTELHGLRAGEASLDDVFHAVAGTRASHTDQPETAQLQTDPLDTDQEVDR